MMRFSNKSQRKTKPSPTVQKYWTAALKTVVMWVDKSWSSSAMWSCATLTAANSVFLLPTSWYNVCVDTLSSCVKVWRRGLLSLCELYSRWLKYRCMTNHCAYSVSHITHILIYTHRLLTVTRCYQQHRYPQTQSTSAHCSREKDNLLCDH